jgi:hypothetical protein
VTTEDKPRRRQGTGRAAATRGVKGRGISAADAADRDRRDEIAYALKLSGEYSLERIAQFPDPERPGKTLYADKSGASRGWRRAAEKHAVGDTSMSERRQLFEQRYETLFRVCWADAIRGGRGYLFAVDRCLAIMKETRDMLGMNAPSQVDVNVTATTDFDAEYRRLTEQIRAQTETAIEHGQRPRQIEGPPEQ